MTFAVERQRHFVDSTTRRNTWASSTSRWRSTTSASIVDGLKSTIAQNEPIGPGRGAADRQNPVLLDLIDREMKQEFNVVLSTTKLPGGGRQSALHSGRNCRSSRIGRSPTRRPSCRSTSSDRVSLAHQSHSARFPAGRPSSLASQMVVVKFGCRRRQRRQLRPLSGHRLRSSSQDRHFVATVVWACVRHVIRCILLELRIPTQASLCLGWGFC